MEQRNEALEIYPDYTSLTIPANIAPLNFKILNDGDLFFIQLRNSKGKSIRIKSRSSNIQFPIKAWKKLLKMDRGGELSIEVSIKSRGDKWRSLEEVKNEIASEDIDPYIAFRKIAPANIVWGEMGLYQRSLESFKEYPLMVNTLTEQNCMNCHTFNQGDPEQLLFHMRGKYGGTMLAGKESIKFVNTKTDYTRTAAVYPSWHPSGKLVAFSVNKISQSFHSKSGKLVNVVDKFSDIVLYDLDGNIISRPAELATEKLENLPSWASDGSSLYYICADESYDTLPYDSRIYHLMNIKFDSQSGKFGGADTLIDADVFGKSVSHPREAPDGKFISFVALDYGYFSIFNQEADLYFYNRITGEILKPEVNSKYTESYPSWSRNSSWLMFVSKRDDGHFSQVWFSYIDEEGSASKPFVLPQKDPDFYKHYLFNYNRPEFISAKVKWTPRKIFSIAKNDPEPSKFNDAESVSISSGATVAAGPGDQSGDDEHYHHD